MNSEIEKLLEKMPLRRPRASLDRRILRSGKMTAIRWSAVAGAVAAAAALLVAALIWQGERHDSPEQSRIADTHPKLPEFPAGPVRLQRDFSQLEYEGIILLDDKTPVRKFHRRILRNVIWMDEQAGFVDEMTMPDEEIILLTAQTY